MSDTTGDAQDSYISLFEAARLLRVSLERITWFIATDQISSIKNPRNKSDRLVSLRDVYGLRNSPHLLGTELRKKSCSRKVDKCGTVFVTGAKSRRFWRVTKWCFSSSFTESTSARPATCCGYVKVYRRMVNPTEGVPHQDGWTPDANPGEERVQFLDHVRSRVPSPSGGPHHPASGGAPPSSRQSETKRTGASQARVRMSDRPKSGVWPEPARWC